MADPLLLWMLAAYAAGLAILGGLAFFRTRTPGDFFVAGRRTGALASGVALMAAAFSGFVFLGGPGLTYRLGLGAFFINAPLGFTAALLCWVVGRRLRDMAGERELFTVADVVRRRFGPGPATAAAVATTVGAVAYLAAQLLALGWLLSNLLAWSLAPAVGLGAAVIVLYSVAGGMVAGTWSDVLQGGIMLAASVVVFFRSLAAVGGWSAMTEALTSTPSWEGFLDPLGRVAPATALGFYFVFGIGVLGQPQMVHRFLMIRGSGSLAIVPWVLGGSQLLCLLTWWGVGLAVPALVASGGLSALGHPDDALPTFLALMPPGLGALVTVAAVAAIMSTADSFLSIAGAALARDLPRSIGRPWRNEVAAARWAAPFLAAAAAVWGLAYGDLVALLGTLAFGTFAAALAPTLSIGLLWDRTSATAVTASILTGLLAVPGWDFLRRSGWDPLPEGSLPAAVALALSFLVLIAVSFRPRTRRPAPAEARRRS